jgi:hypothetical protein
MNCCNSLNVPFRLMIYAFLVVWGLTNIIFVVQFFMSKPEGESQSSVSPMKEEQEQEKTGEEAEQTDKCGGSNGRRVTGERKSRKKVFEKRKYFQNVGDRMQQCMS